MQLKDSVRLDGVRPEIVFAMFATEQAVAMEWKLPTGITITSCVDSVHKSASLHYAGAAFDMRTSDIQQDLLVHICDRIKAALGKTFDVVLEKDHIHIEWQPKTGVNL